MSNEMPQYILRELFRFNSQLLLMALAKHALSSLIGSLYILFRMKFAHGDKANAFRKMPKNFT